MACEKIKYTGRDVILEYQIGCGDAYPLPGDWKRFAALRTKEFSLVWDTTDATADDSVGSLRENLATFQNLSITGDGTCKNSGSGAANLNELTKHVANPTTTGGQPLAWLRMTFPDLTFTALMIISNLSRSAPHDDVVTFSLDASATASDYGLVIEDTPDPDAPEVTALALTPDTVPMVVGGTQQMAVAVTPSGAPASAVYSTSAPAIATVSRSGLVTAVAVGTATITVTSETSPAITDTAAVTVTAA